ncbi:MAG TPA: hypothetical protein VFY97_07545 [Rhodanobacteraceae bacterium]|nr:hypothetical protein [Rhodanobacteraceae bacterium]
MNVQKSLAVLAAMLITAAGIAGIAGYSNAAASSVNRAMNASTTVIRTLPTMNVHPSKAQLQELHNDKAGAAPASLRMPYYSFASDGAGA